MSAPAGFTDFVGECSHRMIMRGTAMGGAVLAVGVIAGLTGAIPGFSRSGTPVAAPLPVSAQTAGCAGDWASDRATLDRVATEVHTAAVSRYAESFTGTEITDRVRVYRKPSAGFDRWIATEFRADCVEMVDAPLSDREIVALRDRIEADRGYWVDRDLELTSVSVGFDGTLRISVGPGQQDRAEDEIPGRYEMPVIITEMDRVPLLGDTRTP